MRFKRLIVLSGVGVVVILIYVLMSGDQKSGNIPQMITTDIPVSVTTVQKQKLVNTISLVGTINASNDVNVISETQGTVKTIFVKVGQFVTSGTVLAQVDDEIPRSNFAAADINYQKAIRDYERSEALFQENSISPAQLDAARLGMKSAENQRDIARRLMANTQIKSPIPGTVNSRQINVGTMVQPGMTVANIVDISTLKVNVNVTEQEAFKLKPGYTVEINTDVYPEHKFNGRVDNIAAKADAAHTYPVEIVVPNDNEYPLKAGMFARVSFTSLTPDEALIIPRLALIGSIRNAQVYRIKIRTANLRSVVIGRQSSELLEVLNGLSKGDTIVTSGQNNLVDGSKVIIIGK